MCEEDEGGTCAFQRVAVKWGAAWPPSAPQPQQPQAAALAPPCTLVSELQREAAWSCKCNINRPFPVLTRWEPALPKDLNSICFIEVSFFSPQPMHQTIILLRSAALSLLLHPPSLLPLHLPSPPTSQCLDEPSNSFSSFKPTNASCGISRRNAMNFLCVPG